MKAAGMFGNLSSFRFGNETEISSKTRIGTLQSEPKLKDSILFKLRIEMFEQSQQAKDSFLTFSEFVFTDSKTDRATLLLKFLISMQWSGEFKVKISETTNSELSSPSRFPSMRMSLTRNPNSDSLRTMERHDQQVCATPQSSDEVGRFRKISINISSGKMSIEHMLSFSEDIVSKEKAQCFLNELSK